MPNIFDDIIPSKVSVSTPVKNIFDDIIPAKTEDNIPEIRNVPAEGLGPEILPKPKPIGYTIQNGEEGIDPFTQLGEFVKNQPLTIPVGIAAPAFVVTQELLSKLPRASSFFKKQLEKLPETADVENLGNLGQEFSYLGKVAPRQDTANLLDSAQVVAEYLTSGKVESMASQKLLEDAVSKLGGKLTAAGFGEAKVTIPQENLVRLGKYTPSGEALLTNLKARTIKIPAQAPEVAGGAAKEATEELGKVIAPFSAEVSAKATEPIKPLIIPTKNIFDDIIPSETKNAPKTQEFGDLDQPKTTIVQKEDNLPLKEGKPVVGPLIPDFKNTEEAVAFGQRNKDNPEILKALEAKRNEMLAQTVELEKTDPESALINSQKAQLPREALEAAQGKIALPEINKQPWQITQTEFRESKRKGSEVLPLSVIREHRKAVTEAFSEGKPIPPEVLADYPELQKPAEFKVGDILDPQGKTNMVGKVTIREIKGNTLKFTDSEGTEFSGMQRSLVRDLINGGSWKKVTTQKEAVKQSVAEGPKTIKSVAEETGILEPNVRRILGVGAKEIKATTPEETKPDITAQYEKYVKEFKEQKYSEPEARRRAKGKLSEMQEKISIVKFPSGKGLGSTAGGKNIEQAQVAEKDEVNKGEFKLYKRNQELIKKYAGFWGEKYQGGQRMGVFYPDTKNIFIRAINDLEVVAHEVMHFIDNKFGITKKITSQTGKSKVGNPIYDSSTMKERKLLTDIYLKNYPGAKANHELKSRMEEGLAMLIQNYIMGQAKVTAEYPDLVNMFFKENGKYYDSTVNNFVKDSQAIIREYNQLDPLAKIGATVMSDSRPAIKDSYLNTKEKLLTEIFDNLYPLEKLGYESGKRGTIGDPSLWVRLYNNKNAMVINNLTSNDRGYWTIQEGSPKKLFNFNWKTVISKLTNMKSFDDFGKWLVARDTKSNFNLLDELKEKSIKAAEFIKSTEKDFEEGRIGGNIRKDIKEAKDTIRHFQELSSTLSKNNISRKTALAAYEQHKERFAEISEMFDKLIRADLDLLYKTGMITDKNYQELTAKEGYAPLKRDILNEVIGTPSMEYPISKPRVGRNKVSSMMSRHGSGLTIINPLHSAMLNHAEIMAKTLRQIVYNKIYDLRESAPGLFQELDLSRSIDKEGRISYPQEKDPNILMGMSGGERLPLLVSKEIKTVLDEVLTYQNLHLFEKILIGANKLFTKGTTGLYLPFTLSNFIVDQTTAAAQTNEKIKPIIDPIKTLSVALHSKMAGFNSDDEKYLEEYLVLGGSRQTLVGWQDLSPDDLYKVLNLEKHYFNRVIDAVERGEDVVAFLPKWSEILTRASEYIKARKSGKPVIVAMEEAGRVTAPFHHRGRLGGGTTGRTAIQSLPFFNAALQVLAQYGRTLHNPESRKRALYVLLAITAASVSSMAYLLAQGTDKQKEEYKSIPTSELSGYVYFPAPDGENLIRIRVPDQMNIIATLMNMAISDEFLDARYNGPEYIDAMTAWIPDQLNITDPARAFTSWIPQLAAPLVGVVTNSKFYPHVRPIESMSLENKAPAERYNEYTSWFAKAMGKELNLSPVKIDFLIQGYLGRYTRFITGQKITNPFIREMYISGTRQIQKFYDLKKENSSEYTALNQRTKKFTAEEIGKIKRTHYKINQIDYLLDVYRKKEKINKDDPVLDKLVSRILSKIDIL